VSARGLTLAFVERINAHDVTGILALASEHHLFVDSLGNELRGCEQLGEAWRKFFEFCPDYAIAIETSVTEKNRVGLFGAAHGTIAQAGATVEWRVMAAWLSVIEAGKVREWRVFADLKPLYEILAVP
jgi:ketosteroid isomerase-like protein